MTRTERATHPRAINKDRSESRNGLDASHRKGGAGNHNWGSLADEQYIEEGALDDEEYEATTEVTGAKTDVKLEAPSLQSPTETPGSSSDPSMERSASAISSTLTEEDKEKAKKLRKNAFKNGQIDLAAIARSSTAISTSPPDSGITRRTGSDDHQVTI